MSEDEIVSLTPAGKVAAELAIANMKLDAARVALIPIRDHYQALTETRAKCGLPGVDPDYMIHTAVDDSGKLHVLTFRNLTDIITAIGD